MADESTVTAWLDLFFAAYYRQHPVTASYIGIHDFDDRLPDCSDHAAGDALADGHALLAEARSVERDLATGTPARPVAEAHRIDLRLAAGFLEIQDWELRSPRFGRGNPCFYTGEALFGVMAPLFTEYAPADRRVAAAAGRLEGFSAFFKQAAANVREAPLGWTERAIRECAAGLVFLTEGLNQLPGDGTDFGPVTRAARKAALGLADYRRHLETEVRHRPVESVAAGEEALALHLAKAHCLPEPADEIARYAEAELAAAQSRIAAAEASASGGEASSNGTGPDYQSVWEAARAAAIDHDLLTWPDFPIRYVARPAWAAKAAPDLYFLCYRSPAAFHGPPVHDYLVPPGDPGASAVKLNHVVHHGGIGHHVQNWHAFRATSRVGRIAAVDGAARIAMLCGGTMAEGWACYATDLMAEIGFLTPAEQLDELRTRARMCARAVVDVRLHQGRLTVGQAAQYYQAAAGMPAAAAQAEAVKNSMFPGAALMYLMGTDRIHRLRRDLAARGNGWSLRAFHDRFLAYGSIPVELIAESMLRNAHAAD